ncbi:MAG TPA: alpha-L-glutamate ligase [Blastocatellia bacterium]|nr:alpha-L-glutamate ligase [Blastocatellia bacterium]
MILVWGSRGDSPVARVLDVLDARGAEHCHIDDSALATVRYDIVFGTTPRGWIESGGRRIAIDDIQSVYLRPGEPAEQGARKAAMVLLALAASLRGVVVNRPAAGRSNASKPYQLRLIAQAGFAVPDTLVTTDPLAARAFLRQHGRLVYKSLSGIRSIVATLDTRDEARLDNVCTGPVQLQAYVPGIDIRVHVVGDRWFACSVRSEAPDYRYAAAAGATAELSAFELPERLGRQLVTLVRGMNLEVAGVDLRFASEDSWVCFEVNPSPGFPWYEEATGHMIAEAVADLLEM